MNKKAQLSIFILLAIVITFSFLIIFIFSKNVGTEKFKTEYNTLAKKKAAVTTVESYITSCLQLSAENTLLLLGKQGGFIFSKKGGSTDSGSIIRRDNQAYWIIRNLNDNPPAYPAAKIYLRDDYIVGATQIPLIQKEGTKTTNYPYIKNEAEKYAASQFGDCMNISLFEEQGIIIKEKRSASIIAAFGDSDTIFYLNYPIEVSVGDYMEKKEKQTIYRSQVRFKSLYQIASGLMQEDTKLSFTLDNNTANQLPSNWLSSEVYVEINPGPDYDTITFHDTKEKQKIYKLIFLRQNRAPVVMPIPDYEVNISDFLNISFVVIDPDEDNFTENINAEKIIFTGAGGRQNQGEIKQVRFRAGASDIGYYEYNFSAKDSGGLSDWQNGVVVKIKCEYYDTSNRVGDKWTAAGKTFDYNPACCDVGAEPTSEYSRLRFRDGETVGGCTCNAQGTCGAVVPPVTCDPACGLCEECVSGGCVPKTCNSGYTCNDATGDCEAEPVVGTCTAGTRRCDGDNACICESDGTETCTNCAYSGDFCSSGKCCYEEDVEVCTPAGCEAFGTCSCVIRPHKVCNV